MSSILRTSAVPSIPKLFLERVRATPDAEALRYPHEHGWRSLTWAEVGQRVRRLAGGFRDLGILPEQRVAILSGTRLEWILADLGVLAAGAATTTVYPSSTADESAFVIADSGSRVVVAEDDRQVGKLRSVRDRLPGVEKVVVVDGTGDGDWVLSLHELEERGADRDRRQPDAFEAVIESVAPDHLATLIYTSGTTGRPKGVELIHDNWLYAAGAVAELEVLRPDDLHFLWLPMSHSFGKVLEVLMIDMGIATAVDGRVDRIAANLAEVRPTIVAGAPRIFEKIHNTVVSTVQQQGGAHLAIFRWARDVGIRASRARQEDRRTPVTLRVQHAVADRLVFSKLRHRFGGRIRYFISGSAPLSQELAEFFDAAGLTILEGYGLTETAAATFVNRPEAPRFGTVGPPLPGTEVKLAEDGEILLRGRGVMRGYHDLPHETAAVLVEGWLRTGDIGELDEAGRLRITDRKKELIKTSGGKYVAPQHVEGRIKAASPYVSNVVVHGDRRKFCSALVTLDEDAIGAWARGRGLPPEPSRLHDHRDVRALIRSAIAEVNATLARHETVKQFAILPEDFSVETGELTPSLKVRRREVEQRYADILDGFYADPVRRI